MLSQLKINNIKSSTNRNKLVQQSNRLREWRPGFDS